MDQSYIMKKILFLLFMSVTGVICYGQQGDSSVTVGKAELDSLRKRIERLESGSGDGVRSSERKPEYKIGGWLEARFMYNSYASKSPRENLMFYYPLKPEYGPDGRDINDRGSLNFSVFSSRLSFGVGGVEVGRAKLSTYLEADFLGSSDAFNYMLRLRQAYIDIAWSDNLFRIGQTNHLTFPENMVPATVTFNGGTPFATLNRGPQIRYSRHFKRNIDLSVAAEYYSSHKSVGPEKAQINAAIPDIHARVEFGDPNKIMGGFAAGYKFFEPRTSDAEGNKVSRMVAAFDVNAFLAFTANGYKFKVWGIYGQNLTPYGIIGGYGKRLGDSEYGDYRYTNIYSMSAWFDFSTPSYSNIAFGFFAGYQSNLGSLADIDTSVGYYRDCDLRWFSRLSPRLYYYMGSRMRFGLEYSYANARWMKKYDERFRSVEDYSMSETHRVEFQARFYF